MPDRVATRLLYDAGARARDAGYTHLENPNPVGSPEYEVWFRGWRRVPDPSVAPQFTNHTPVRRDS